jgi:hypothetical protein
LYRQSSGLLAGRIFSHHGWARVYTQQDARPVAGQARITVFEGGHDSEPAAAIAWLARQRRGQAADFTLGSAAASAAEAVGK